jgi:hypothetical protein
MYNNVIKLISRFRIVLFSIALIVLLVSCNDDEDYVNEPIEVAYVSVYHASPDAPAFDIVVDDRVINTWPFDYSSYSGYLNFFTGNRNIQFNAVNADNALIDTTFNFEQGKAYSLFAINRVSGLEALLVVDSAAAPPEGKAMVRFVHLSPDAPAFDIAIEGETAPLFAGRSFRGATAFKEVEAGTRAFEVKNDTEVVLATEQLEIRAGRYYTIIVRGFAVPPQGNTNVLSVEVLD